MRAATRISTPMGLRVPNCVAHGGTFLVIEFIALDWSWSHAEEALLYLAKLHALEVFGDLKCFYHGRELSERLDRELGSIDKAPQSFHDRNRAVALARRVRALPQLRAAALAAAPRVIGHGDFHGQNLRMEASGGGVRVVPVDWIDFGICDPRYELAHFLDSAPHDEDFEVVAARVYGREFDAVSFHSFVAAGRAMNALVSLGSLARRHGAPAPEPEVDMWLRRMEAVLVELERASEDD